MAYQVLARKWRPSNFTQLVGQEHVSQSLINALQHNRLHHAYLFTGTRGVGKTTVARILAKAINCENLRDFNPCGECSICIAFEQNSFMDLIEIDAASRTKVEDTRDLLDNVQYTPNQGRYKVYLIDEVHMLSNHSFNALLKTLEEPPAHVKFLLATTDPQKIPVTVLSRCLQFNLKRLFPEQISKQMQFILEQENIKFEITALNLIARSADGSLRDGLSLLDQAIVHGNGSIIYTSVSEMLGTVAIKPVEEILTNLAKNNVGLLLSKISEIAELTPNFTEILEKVLRILHRVAIVQQAPNFIDDEFDGQFIAFLANELQAEDVQLFYQIGLIGQRDLELAPDPRTGFEMVLLRMLTFRPINSKTILSSPKPEDEPKQTEIRNSTTKTQQLSISNNTESLTTVPNITDKGWPDILNALNLNGLSKQLAYHCVLASIDESSCHLLLDPNFKQISGKSEDKIREALQNYFKKPLKLIITQKASDQMTPAMLLNKQQEERQLSAVEIINSDDNINALKETFGARIIPGSIEPI